MRRSAGLGTASCNKLRSGTPLRVVATRANIQPAFGCYLPVPPSAIARAYGLLVLKLEGDRIAAITWFSDTGVFAHFGLPRTLRAERLDDASSQEPAERGMAAGVVIWSIVSVR